MYIVQRSSWKNLLEGGCEMLFGQSYCAEVLTNREARNAKAEKFLDTHKQHAVYAATLRFFELPR